MISSSVSLSTARELAEHPASSPQWTRKTESEINGAVLSPFGADFHVARPLIFTF